ncbi:MAG TPA: hypothetical protein VLB90_00440 [Pseudomonadales bacterium]|nr:hypothetical protein [Pseudomonadales bacterium]
MSDLLESMQQLKNAPDNLTVPFMYIYAHLRNERIGYTKLCKRKTRYGELADTDNTYTKLTNANYPATKLANGNDTFCNNRQPVQCVFKRDMKQWQTGNLPF